MSPRSSIYRPWILSLDLLLLLAGLVAFHRTTVRATLPFPVRQSGDAVVIGRIPEGATAPVWEGERILSLDGQKARTEREAEYLLNGKAIGSVAYLELRGTPEPKGCAVPLVRFHSTRYLMVQGVVGFLFMGIGWLLYLKRPGDFPARVLHLCFILVGLMVLMTPTRYTGAWLGLSRCVDFFSAGAFAFAPALLLHFGLVFPRQHFSQSALRIWTRAVYGTACAMTVWVTWTNTRVSNPVTLDDFAAYDLAYGASRWFLCACVIIAVSLLVRSGFNPSGDAERRQMKWILMGLSTGPFIWAATWQIPILMGREAIVSEEASLAILATVPVVFAIAIIQYRFMDVDVVVHSGLVLAISGGLAAVFWAINSSVLASVTAALLVVMLFEGQERERLNRMKSFFVSGISHDLKTPLTGIKVHTHLLKNSRRLDSAKRQKFLEIIEGETDRLTRLIDNVLNFSRIERGGREYKMVPSDLNEVVRETLHSMEYPLRMGGFRLRRRYDRGVLHFEADRDAVNEAVGNLIANAIKYSGSERRLAVETLRMPDYVGVRVRDWGIGIPQDEQSRIFEPFFRSGQEKAKSAGGVGLGLALVKHIVDAHGGYVDVVSSPAQGSIFTLWFPGKGTP